MLPEYHQSLCDGIGVVVFFDLVDDAGSKAFGFWNKQESGWAIDSFGEDHTLFDF